MTWAKITFGGHSYQITDEDVLWMARAVAGEGGDARDHLAIPWTYAQRFALLYPRFTSLATLIRNHSQPVNPRWARGGEFCGPGGRYVGDERCSEARLAARDRAAARTLADIPTAIRYIVTQWAKGWTSNPVPRAVDFADPTQTAAFVRGNPGAEYVARYGNHYLSTAASRAWPWRYVTMGISPWLFLGVGLVGGGLAIAAWRYLQKAQRRRR